VLGFGNEKGVVGRNGWLFYQPGIDYLAGPDLIEKSHLEALAKKMVDKQRIAEPYPDPRPAILGLNRDLGKYGIRLVVLPAPEKAALQLAELTGRSILRQSAAPPNNRGYARFAAELWNFGVDVFDPTPQKIGPGEVRFLAQDTHWTPVFMDEIAGRLATHIANLISLSPDTVSYRLEDESVTRAGDLVDMLNLTKNQRLYLPETVRIRKVIDTRTQKPFEPDPGAEILLLGDSYTNIYSQPDMGWGRGSGLAEHLAYHLQRPVDVIAFNGGGTSRTRGELARRENEERLGRKKVVVYEFAVRDLLGENWKPMPVAVPKLPQVPDTTMKTPVPAPVTKHSVPFTSAPPHGSTAAAEVPAKEPAQSVSENEPLKTEKHDAAATTIDPTLIVIGEIVKTSNVPRPGTAPYKDCLTFVKVRVEKIEAGSYDDSELVVVFWAMKDNEWLPAASYSVGDRLRMTLIPLKKAGRQIRSMQRADDLDDFVHQPYYAIQETRP
jgi:alginate O-acetyltransferase complex protein AlgJ